LCVFMFKAGEGVSIKMSFSLQIDLTPEQCYRKLLHTVIGDKKVEYWLFEEENTKSTQYSFELKKQTLYRNSFSPILYGTIKPFETGTQVEGKFHVHFFTRVLIGISVVFSIFMLMAGNWSAWNLTSFLCLVGAFPIFMGTVFVIGRYVIGSREESFLRSYVVDIFCE
jgi:hypothetical protein